MEGDEDQPGSVFVPWVRERRNGVVAMYLNSFGDEIVYAFGIANVYLYWCCDAARGVDLMGHGGDGGV